jgi:hypothetical protein
MPRRLAHGTEASSSCAILPATGAVVARSGQKWGRVGAPPAHFDVAQAEQALWQEFRDRDASLNNALNEALRVHGEGLSWRIFQVRIFRQIRALLPCPFCIRTFLTLRPPASRLLATEAGGPGSGAVQLPRPTELRARLVPGAVRLPRRPRGGLADRQRVAGVPSADGAGRAPELGCPGYGRRLHGRQGDVGAPGAG